MTALKERLDRIVPSIERICDVSGIAGLSLGIISRGQIVTTIHHGYKNIDNKAKPDDDTAYGIGSLTKGFTAATLASLVDEGAVTWDTSIKSIIPDFRTTSAEVTERLTVKDALAHRMGLTRSNQLWHGKDNHILIEKSHVIKHFTTMRNTQPFRSKMHYNNWGYALAGAVVEKLTEQDWGTAVTDRVLRPFGLSKTYTRPHESADFASPYAALDDRTCVPLEPFKVKAGTLMDSSQGLWSTVTDMLQWCSKLLRANEQQNNKQDVDNESMIQLTEIFSPQIKISDDEKGPFYGLGWALTDLPSPMGALGCNPGLISHMPTVGKSSKERIIYSQGSLAGYTANLILVPGQDVGIAVLTNSIALNDGADWVAQAVLEAVLDEQQPNDFVQAATTSAQSMVDKFPQMEKRLRESQHSDAPPKRLTEYTGVYRNDIKDFCIGIREDGSHNALALYFQDKDSQRWPLKHYQADEFTWLMSHDEAVRHARFPYPPEKIFKFGFESSNGQISGLWWTHDLDSEPEFFQKTSGPRDAGVGSSSVGYEPASLTPR
ncbi:beta-lactamase/transpeptidase-like protein [Pseudovirgaria hyperparasitica]|uniref:Beta-lactamase/transpeptidase-like protein n=1 Tax=Pseudovirgaria hyperparasitica TaxID=470096 RepID=A0A6A6WH46_9PEZI|nr:beta-lactamase/transpeptidase-like protein [Pseudovirgaria hyperparasitica]KAF2761539.1 beta-lactamase/transpeptidase-like protein [Pseudovirgaria hyperparasitica]